MLIDLKGKTAVVTGGANGIGLAIARTLSSCGASVWVLDLGAENPREAGRSLGGDGLVADISDRASLDAALARIGPPDIVAANAGAVAEHEFCETPAEVWHRLLAVNLTGAFHTVQAAATLMKPRRSGSIVLTASTNSFDGEARLTAYNATKAGLLGLLHTAANELGPFGIRLNAVCPGLIRTRLTAAHFSSPTIARDYFRDIPLGRGGEPGEVANAVAFLASDLASFITGATLFVDGGQMAAKFGTWNDQFGEFRGDRWFVRE